MQVEDDDEDGEMFKPKGAAAPSEMGMNRIYGVWQTRPWAAPAARGGQVPKNERGQVDCPPFSLALPEGAPRSIARTLALEFLGLWP